MTLEKRNIGCVSATRIPVSRVLAGLALALFSTQLAAGKPPQQIRQHLLEHPEKSVASVGTVEPLQDAALEELLEARIWKVAYSEQGSDGESLVFMAVEDGQVLRIRDFDDPNARDNLVRLLPDDFRVTSKSEAARLVTATLALHFGFPFGEPEKTVDEMRFARSGGDFYFVDGERFGDATGYRISVDEAGRVIGYEYSWELPVEPARHN